MGRGFTTDHQHEMHSRLVFTQIECVFEVLFTWYYNLQRNILYIVLSLFTDIVGTFLKQKQGINACRGVENALRGCQPEPRQTRRRELTRMSQCR